MQQHSQGFLSELLLMPPAGNAGWQSGAATLTPLVTAGGTAMQQWPLFWYDPPWHSAEPATALAVADAVARLGIAVSAMATDLAADSASQPGWPHRIVPYRADRYGLRLDDLRAAHVVEVRLAAPRDAAGRFAYSPRQLQRWMADDGAPSGIDTALPALHWPPELRTLSDLEGKLQQLRRLAPQAACFVSLGPFRLAEELPVLVRSGADGVVLRLDDLPELSGNHTAQLVVMARQLIARSGQAAGFPLWVVPPVDPTADDCVKLMALGATAIAIDAWCNPLLQAAAVRTASTWSDAALGQRRQPDPVEQFGPDLDRLAGLIRSCGVLAADDLNGSHLTTVDQHLAVQLGVGWLLDVATAPRSTAAAT